MKRSEQVVLGSLIGLGLTLRLVLFRSSDIYEDTAYYWLWSQRIELSYFDHPPLIAWALRALGLGGLTAFVSVGTVAAAAWLARAMSAEARAPWYAAAIVATAPAFILSSAVINPDGLLFLFVLLAFGFAWRGRVLTAGLAMGLALLSKYPALLVAPALVVLSYQRLGRAGAWRIAAATALAAACCTPILVWNAQHHWASFAFQFEHGVGLDPVTLKSFSEPILSQLALVGPVGFLLAVWWSMRGPREHLALRLAALIPWVVFFSLGLRTHQESNWPALGSVVACLGIVPWLATRPRWFGWVIGGPVAVSLAGTLWLSVPTPLTRPTPPIARTHGYGALAVLAQRGAAVAYSSHYGTAAEVSYYANLPVTTMNGRESQFDFWPRPSVAPQSDALWVSVVEDEPPPDELAAMFESIDGPTTVEGRFGQLVTRRFLVWQLRHRKP